jgi:Tfp pilus assembly protein PilN
MSNDVPEEIEETTPSGSRLATLGTWLAVVSLCALLATLFLISTTIKDLNTTAESDLAELQAIVGATASPDPTEDALISTLVDIRGQVSALQPVQTELSANHRDWPTMMQYLAAYDPTQMTLTMIQQTGDQLVLEGEALNEGLVTSYASQLGESGFFARVTVQSLSVRILPTATPVDPAAPAVSAPAGRVVQFVIILDTLAG